MSELNEFDYVYLASPYSARDFSLMESRYQEAMRCTSWMLKQKIWTYSPITHCHVMAQVYKLPTDFVFWQHYNRAMIYQARELYVLAIEGWDKSVGVGEELKFAQEHGMLILKIMPEGEAYVTKRMF